MQYSHWLNYVYFQVIQRKTLIETSIDPREWGRKIVGNKYIAVMTDVVRWLTKLMLLPYNMKLRNHETKAKY